MFDLRFFFYGWLVGFDLCFQMKQNVYFYFLGCVIHHPLTDEYEIQKAKQNLNTFTKTNSNPF